MVANDTNRPSPPTNISYSFGGGCLKGIYSIGMKLPLPLLLALASGFATLVGAATITVNCTTITSGQDFRSALIQCPQFSATGFLSSIGIDVTDSANGSLSQSYSGPPQYAPPPGSSVGAILVREIDLVFPQGFANPFRNRAAGDGAVASGVDGVAFPFALNSLSRSMSLTDVSAFSSYVGSGSFALGVTTFTNTLPRPDFTTMLRSISVSATASVTYSFSPTAVPEPAGWVLMSLGLIAGIAKRRRYL